MTTVGNIKIFGLPDLCALPATMFTAESTASSDYPASNLKTEVPSDTWRSLGYSPLKTSYYSASLYDGGVATHSIGGVALVNHNLWPWTGEVRFILEDGGPTAIGSLFEICVPLAVIDSNNMTGAVGDVNNGFTTDGLGMLPTDNSLVWDVTMSINPPTKDLRLGNRLQAFCVFAKSQGNRRPYEACTMQVELREDGSLIRLLQSKAVCSNAGQWYIFPWSADELADVSGGSIQIKLTMESRIAASPEEFIFIDEVLLLAENVDSVVNAPNYLTDSGWLPAGSYIGNPLALANTLPVEMTRGDCVAWDYYNALLSTDREWPAVAYIRVLIREDHSPDTRTYDVTTFPVSPPGYVEVGHGLACGAVFTTTVNFSIGPLDGIRDLSVTKFTQDGGQYGQRNGILRTGQVEFPALTKVEKAFIMDRLLRRRGVSRPVLISLTPGDALESEALTFYATLSQQETVASTQLLEDYRRKLGLNFLEYV